MFNPISSSSLFALNTLKHINKSRNLLSKAEYSVKRYSKKHFRELVSYKENNYKKQFFKCYMNIVKVSILTGCSLVAFKQAKECIQREHYKLIPFFLLRGALFGGVLGLGCGITAPISFPLIGAFIMSKKDDNKIYNTFSKIFTERGKNRI